MPEIASHAIPTQIATAPAMAVSDCESPCRTSECLRCGQTMFLPDWSGYLDRHRVPAPVGMRGANWKGYLRLSLVSCPIALYPASSLSEKVSFNRINRKTGNRLKQQNVDSETGDVVPREDIARGYEIGKGQYLIVED